MKIFTEERLTELKEHIKGDIYYSKSYVIYRDLMEYITEIYENCKKLEDKIDNLNQGENNEKIIPSSSD